MFCIFVSYFIMNLLLGDLMFYVYSFYFLLWQLSKDIYDEQEDVAFSWVREYHWDVRVRPKIFMS